jgi:hypothetical protein
MVGEAEMSTGRLGCSGLCWAQAPPTLTQIPSLILTRRWPASSLPQGPHRQWSTICSESAEDLCGQEQATLTLLGRTP